MALRLFVFLQLEFPWALGPADGRYMMRAREGDEPERVLVLQTDGATSAEPRRTSTRVTIIDPVSLSAEQQAKAWLEELERDGDRGVREALEVVNRVLYLHRLAAVDPRVNQVSASQAVAARAGWGEGEQLASGRWEHASELPLDSPARRRLLRRGSRRERSGALMQTERLAALLGARERPLICEELALRARADLDAGRLCLAALELRSALAGAGAELRAESRHDLALRLDELERLSTGVQQQAAACLAGGEQEPGPDSEVLAHALGRLEAALRARRLRV